jgi:hypothetical protein
MTRDELSVQLFEVIRARGPAMRYYEILRRFADAGGDAQTADAVLVAFKPSDEAEQDTINDARDIIHRFCAPQFWVWPG